MPIRDDRVEIVLRHVMCLIGNGLTTASPKRRRLAQLRFRNRIQSRRPSVTSADVCFGGLQSLPPCCSARCRMTFEWQH